MPTDVNNILITINVKKRTVSMAFCKLSSTKVSFTSPEFM